MESRGGVKLVCLKVWRDGSRDIVRVESRGGNLDFG